MQPHTHKTHSLLDTIANRLELVGEVLATGWRSVKITLNHHCKATEKQEPHHDEQNIETGLGNMNVQSSTAITYRRTMRSRCLRFIEVVIRETPSYGTRCIKRTSNLRAIVAIRGNGLGSNRHGRAGAGIDGSFQVNQIYRISSHSTTCDHETRRLVVRLNRDCVCLAGVSRVRFVWRTRTVPSMRRKGRPTEVCQFCGLFSIRLLIVSRSCVLEPA